MTVEMLEEFLRTVDKTFPVPLSEKQELAAYAEKLNQKATLCAACEDGKILSLVAGYTENLPEDKAYIAVVATRPEAKGRGLAAEMVRQFLDICRQKKIGAVHLYVVTTNEPAVKMYRKLGFQTLIQEDEPRPDDSHLIFYLNEEN